MSEYDEIYEKAIKIVKAICKKHNIDHSYIPKEHMVETMPCPCCGKGTMTYTISSYNGHRSAQCSEECFGLYVE